MSRNRRNRNNDTTASNRQDNFSDHFYEIETLGTSGMSCGLNNRRDRNTNFDNGCGYSPIEVADTTDYRLCCDTDGNCAYYPEHCRDSFWPDFSHPRSLSCDQLYRG